MSDNSFNGKASDNQNKISGKILKSVGGFCTVETSDGVFSVKPKGIFRLRGISPVVGDNVILEREEANAEFVISDIRERKNFLVRPPLANLDLLVFVLSACEPKPNTMITDKLLAISQNKGVEAVLVFTKTELDDVSDFAKIYNNIGYSTFEIDSISGKGIDEVKAYLQGKFTALIGNSGVGKSTLLNAIIPNLWLDTQEISNKLGRGKHTTRHVEIYHSEGLCIADTPGFSTVDIERYGRIEAENIQHCFREFAPFIGECRFADCSHLSEIGCAIKESFKRGDISPSRYKSYEIMYNEAKKLNSWE